jgi:hypothetical protein
MTLVFVITAVFLAAQFFTEWYFRQLPVAPACPACRSLVRRVIDQSAFPGSCPGFAATFLAECRECGWHGRMRWTLARNPARHGGPA